MVLLAVPFAVFSSPDGGIPSPAFGLLLCSYCRCQRLFIGWVRRPQFQGSAIFRNTLVETLLFIKCDSLSIVSIRISRFKIRCALKLVHCALEIACAGRRPTPIVIRIGIAGPQFDRFFEFGY